MTNVENSCATQLTELANQLVNSVIGYNQMSVELKVKAKTLATEARHISKEERKSLRMSRWDRQNNFSPAMNLTQYNVLRDHRVGVVRPEARATHLARAYLSGRTYRSVEASTRRPVHPSVIVKVGDMLKRFGMDTGDENLLGWFKAA